MKAQDIRTLTALALAKGHMEALRRIQLAFEKEIGDASIKHHCTEERYAKLQKALNTISDVFSTAESSIENSFDNLKFNLEYELEKKEGNFTIQYEIELRGEIYTREYTNNIEKIQERFYHVVHEAYNDGTLHSVTLYRGDGTDAHCVVCSGYNSVEDYVQGDE